MDPTDFYAYIQSLTPEQQAALLGNLAIPGENAQLEGQIAQAQALRNPRGARHEEWIGTSLEGVGDFLRQISGGMKERDLRGRIDANTAKLKDPSRLPPMAKQEAIAKALMAPKLLQRPLEEDPGFMASMGWGG